MFKICTRCNIEQSSEQYYKKSHFRKYPTSKAGYDSHCKKCVALDRKEFLSSNPLAKKQADHKTNKVRGLLCVTCNLILGYAMDEASTLENLIKYLKSNNSVPADKPGVGDNIISFERKSLG